MSFVVGRHVLRRIRNLIGSRWGWSFCATSLFLDRRVVHEGETIVLSGGILNDGLRCGTAYAQFLIANSYRRDRPIFDSDCDLSQNERRSLRLVDIRHGDTRKAACNFTVPPGSALNHFDVRLRIWNPHRLLMAQCRGSSTTQIGLEVLK